eukprot:3344782-Alexandrium_andersonii.AAC.1
MPPCPARQSAQGQGTCTTTVLRSQSAHARAGSGEPEGEGAQQARGEFIPQEAQAGGCPTIPGCYRAAALA